MISDKLVDGTITAIDQSSKMIEAARKKNAKHMDSGKALFQCASLLDFESDRRRYNKIFAVNVNVFWMEAKKELERIRQLLLPEGKLYLFNQPPSSAKIAYIAERTQQQLMEHGFDVAEILGQELQPASCVCVIGKWRDGR